MKENRLKHLFVEELKDIYSAENQMVKALPKLAKAATSPGLRAGFEEHLTQTKEHVARYWNRFLKLLVKVRRARNARAWKDLLKCSPKFGPLIKV